MAPCINALGLQKPERLRPGDTVAAVSLSWGGAGDPDLRWRYEVGKRRLETVFGLRVVELPHTLMGSETVYEHPEIRARDLMGAFRDPEIKGIFSCIGGDESIRLLPYVESSVIRENPKIFLGYSDSTVTHFFCLKAGLSSFYGPSILAEFGENVEIFPYTEQAVRTALFSPAPIGALSPAAEWTGQRVEWTEENRDVRKVMQPNPGPCFLQGSGKASGPLLGGCMEVLQTLKGTSLWPEGALFEGAVLFLETSEVEAPPWLFEDSLRSFGAMGILQKLSGLLFGRPYQNRFAEEYAAAARKVLREFRLEHLPVVTGMDFGHNEPMCVLPLGALTEIDCEAKTVSILESGVI